MSKLLRQIKGAWWTVKSDSRIIMITKSTHPDAVRLRTKYIIESLIVDVLNEPWSQSFAKRITRPQGQKEKKEKNTDTAYAQFIGTEDGDTAMREFTALKTDPERSEWLLRHRDEVILYGRGKEIIEQYYNELTTSKKEGASPPLRPPQDYIQLDMNFDERY